MKKFIFIFLFLLIIIATVWALNYFNVISIKAWGEKALTSLPILKDYLKTNEAYQQLHKKWLDQEEKIKSLLNSNEELERALSIARQQVADQREKIAELEGELKALRQARQSAEEKLKQLVDIYEEMDAEKAAGIITSLNKDTVIKLLTNLDAEKAAAILSSLPPEEAASYSSAIEEGF